MFAHSTRLAATTAALFLAAPALAQAQSVSFSTSPVALTSCTIVSFIDQTSFGGPVDFLGGRIRLVDNVDLQYVNKSAVPATAVTFIVSSGAQARRFVSHGIFSPNVQIDKTFERDVRDASSHGAACTVAEVLFADGSAWHADRLDLVAR